jgi:aerobic carbon-monoxide dehydrogenase small subunit
MSRRFLWRLHDIAGWPSDHVVPHAGRTDAQCEIRTVESLAPDGVLSPLQQAMEQYDAVQCGMCFPGILMSLTSFLERTPSPTREEIKAALVGNICRCTGYERIIDAAFSLVQAT